MRNDIDELAYHAIREMPRADRLRGGWATLPAAATPRGHAETMLADGRPHEAMRYLGDQPGGAAVASHLIWVAGVARRLNLTDDTSCRAALSALPDVRSTDIDAVNSEADLWLQLGHPDAAAGLINAVPRDQSDELTRALAIGIHAQRGADREAVELANQLLRGTTASDTRAYLASVLLELAVSHLLPITEPHLIARYAAVADTAQRAANGLPDAEILVRAHVRWAAESDDLVLSSGRGVLSFVDMLSGRALSGHLRRKYGAARWRLWLDGPGDRDPGSFAQLVGTPSAHVVHRSIDHRLRWRMPEERS